MRKSILLATAIPFMLLTGCDSFSPDIQNNALMEPDAEYEIDTWGSNSEVYEFTPRGNPNYTCTFVMLDSGKDMGLQCFPKPEAKEI